LAKTGEKRHCSTFVFIWQTLSNYRVTRLKRFIPRFIDELCKYFLFSYIFNAPCMYRKIRCDGESWNILRTKQGLNKTLHGKRWTRVNGWDGYSSQLCPTTKYLSPSFFLRFVLVKALFLAIHISFYLAISESYISPASL